MIGNLHFIPKSCNTTAWKNPIIFILSVSTIWANKAAFIDLLFVTQYAFRFHLLVFSSNFNLACIHLCIPIVYKYIYICTYKIYIYILHIYCMHTTYCVHQCRQWEAMWSRQELCPWLRWGGSRRAGALDTTNCQQLGAPISGLSHFRLFKSLQTQRKPLKCFHIKFMTWCCISLWKDNKGTIMSFYCAGQGLHDIHLLAHIEVVLK